MLVVRSALLGKSVVRVSCFMIGSNHIAGSVSRVVNSANAVRLSLLLPGFPYLRPAIMDMRCCDSEKRVKK